MSCTQYTGVAFAGVAGALLLFAVAGSEPWCEESVSTSGVSASASVSAQQACIALKVGGFSLAHSCVDGPWSYTDPGSVSLPADWEGMPVESVTDGYASLLNAMFLGRLGCILGGVGCIGAAVAILVEVSVSLGDHQLKAQRIRSFAMFVGFAGSLTALGGFLGFLSRAVTDFSLMVDGLEIVLLPMDCVTTSLYMVSGAVALAVFGSCCVCSSVLQPARAGKTTTTVVVVPTPTVALHRQELPVMRPPPPMYSVNAPRVEPPRGRALPEASVPLLAASSAPTDMACPACSETIPAAAGFCPYCGNTTASKCASCGAKLAPAARFCGGCGAKCV